MTEPDSGYDLKPDEKPPAPPQPPVPSSGPPKPGEPGWVPPVPVVEYTKLEPGEEPPDPDTEQHKGMAILAYVCFLIPLLAAPKSKFARFHANQGLLSFIFWCVAIVGNVFLWVIHGLMERYLTIPVLYGFFTCIIYLLEPVLLMVALGLAIYGVIQAANGERKKLPVIGQISLIK